MKNNNNKKLVKMNSVIRNNLIQFRRIQFRRIIRKEDTKSPSVSPIIAFCQGRPVTSKATPQGRKWIRLEKGTLSVSQF